MTLGIMQPYVFPYLGYFQYMRACDTFLLYDDVQFIMRGWINRNNILLNGEAHLFTIPLVKASPNRSINEVAIARNGWEDKLLRTMDQAYRRAPHFAEVMPEVERVLRSGHTTIAGLATDSITYACRALGISTTVLPSSAPYSNASLPRNERLVDLCKKLGAARCVVPFGGSALYPKDGFAANGIELSYLVANLSPYQQVPGREFVPSLSVIDALMFNDAEQRAALVNTYDLA